MSERFSRIISGTVVRGHQVASGLSKQERFPGGTLAMQVPCFQERGLDLSSFYLATLNVDFSPSCFRFLNAAHTFRDVKWHPSEPAEDFSFFDCEILEPTTQQWIAALVYYPHPETKPDHEQPAGVLEILARGRIEGVSYGVTVEVRIDENQFTIQQG